MGATWTVIDDRLGRLLWPPLGRAADLVDNEVNVAGADVDGALLRWQGRHSRPFYVRQRKGRWILRVHRDGVVVDDVDVDVGADVVLAGGEVIGVPSVGLRLRFAFVDAPPLTRLFACTSGLHELVLFDHGGVPGPGRFWGLAKRDGGVVPVCVVTRLDAGGVHCVVRDDVPRGVPLRELCGRGAGVEPSLALSILGAYARRALTDRGALGSVDRAFVGFDGSLHYLPALVDETAGPYGALVELFTHLLPESSPWWTDETPASVAARTLWRRMVGPYVGGLGNRARQPDDVATVDAIVAAVDAIDVVREVGDVELRDVARGLFPEEWRREQQLADELAVIVDGKGFDALAARAAR